MNREEIGKKLRELRMHKGCDVQTVCKYAGISSSALAMYECGARIPRDEIKVRLASFYGVSVESLFFSSACSRKVSRGDAV